MMPDKRQRWPEDLPSWVPASVADLVLSSLGSNGKNENQLSDTVRRLVTDERMRDVWGTLKNYANDPESVLPEYLIACNAGILRWRRFENSKTCLSRASAEARLKPVREFVDQLIASLEDEDTALAVRLKVHSFSGVDDDGLGDAFVWWATHDLPAELELIESQLAITALLQGREPHREDPVQALLVLLHQLQMKLNSGGSLDPSLPRKLKAKTAARTSLVIELHRFMFSRFCRPLHAAVATTANVLFEDDELEPETVRKIVKRYGNILGRYGP